MSRRVITVGLALSAILTTGAATAVAATASPAAVHPSVTRMHSCAQTLYVRKQPLGQTVGTLYYGNTFDVESYDAGGSWAYGMAYGHVNQHGWVEASYLC